MTNYNYPPQIPMKENIYNMTILKMNPLVVYPKNFKKYGPSFFLNIPRFDLKIIVTEDPKLIEYILQKNHKNYHKSRVQTENLAKYIGYGLLTNNGEDWLKQRRLIQPSFNKGKIEILSKSILEEVTNVLSNVTMNQSVDVHQLMNNLTFRIIAKNLFGHIVSDQELNKTSNLIAVTQELFTKELRRPYLNWWYNMSGQIKKHIAMSKETNKVFQEIINERRSSGKRYDDMLDMLMQARYEDTNEPMTDEKLIDEMLIIFVAGHETTANALSWAIYLLGKNPDVVAKIIIESNELGEALFNAENLIKPSYAMACVNEAMRLYPPAWLMDRVTLDDDEFGDYKWEKGTMILSYIYGLHRNKDSWQNPEKFDPERFLQSKKTPENFIPFGAGPRMCIGNHFAMMEMVTTIRWICKNWNIELLTKNTTPQPFVTLKPDAIRAIFSNI